MNHFIIGTAGHIDHGKTALIRALTGIETDRLKEEKKRGITIELGFAYMDLNDGEKAGIVDVPGHEKFIKNMLAGVGGIDMVLLIIAADEGVMPQTVEHMNILSLLGIENSLIVLTKVELVDDEWLSMVEEDIRMQVADTFLSEAPILKVSAHNNIGIDELKETIIKMSKKATKKDTTAPARMPIDRIFTMDGFGTVVTGTLIEGTIKIGDKMTVYPQEHEAKVKQIQVHKSSENSAFAGQRVAINLTNISKDDISRGNVLAPEKSLLTTMILDAKLNLVKGISRSVINRTRIRFYSGTSEVFGRITLLEGDELKESESAYVQLRLEEAVALKTGDHFVIRFYSPLETIGGGIVLDVDPSKHQRGTEAIIEGLKIKESGNDAQKIEHAILNYSPVLPKRAFISTLLNIDKNIIDQVIDNLITANSVIKIKEDMVMHIDAYHQYLASAKTSLDKYHKAYPLRKGMPLEEFRSRTFSDKKNILNDDMMIHFQNDGIMVNVGVVYLADFKVMLNESAALCKTTIVETLLNSRFKPPTVAEILCNNCTERDIAQIVEMLIDDNIIIRVDEVILFHADVIEEAKSKVKSHIATHHQITLGEFRDLISTSRKYAVALLEYFDRIHFTKKQGDGRILVNK